MYRANNLHKLDVDHFERNISSVKNSNRRSGVNYIWRLPVPIPRPIRQLDLDYRIQSRLRWHRRWGPIFCATTAQSRQQQSHSRTVRMEPTSHPWQPSTSAHALASSCIDSDCHWDATVQLLALGDDDPAQELYDGTISGGKKPEPEDGGGRGVPAAAAIFQPRTYECGPIIGTLALTDKPSADIRLSAMLSEDDIAFIVSSTAHDDAPADVPIDPGSPSAAAGTSELATSVQQRADPRRRSAAATEAMALTTAPVSSAEEARRERNRLKVRRLYHRKLVCVRAHHSLGEMPVCLSVHYYIIC